MPPKLHLQRTAAAAALACLPLAASAVEYTWNSGSFVPGTTAPGVLAAGDVLNILSTGAKTFSGVSFANLGTVNWQGGHISMGGNAAVSNAGLWDIQGDLGFSYLGGGASFTNTGTLRKSAGTGETLLPGSALSFTNSGSIDVQSGTLRITSVVQIQAGSQFIGAGVLSLGGGSYSGSFSSANLLMDGGTHSGVGAVMNGSVRWQSGTLSGGWQVAAGQNLALVGTGTRTLSGTGTVLDNQGTLRWGEGVGALQVTGNATLNNAGLWDWQGDNLVSYAGGGAHIQNTGTLRKSGGTGTATLNTFNFSNSGSIEVQAGTLRVNTSNSTTIHAGSSFTGAGVLSLGGGLYNGSFSSANLLMDGGTHTGAGAVINGRVRWQSGTMNGSWQVAAGQRLELEGPALHHLSGTGAVLQNNGTLAWAADAGALQVGSNATLANAGLWDWQGDHTVLYPGGGALIDNTGTLRKSGGTGTATLNTWNFANSGTIDVQSGVLRVVPGNVSTVNTGSQFIGAGTLELGGSVAYNGSFTSSNLRMAAGTHAGNGAVLQGQAAMVAGTFTGGWQVAPGATLVLQTAAGKAIAGNTTVFTNQGTVVWEAGNVSLSSAASVVNNGLFDATGDDAFTYPGGGAGWVNNGVLRKSAGTGTTSVAASGLNFSNPGTVDVRTGTIALPASFHNTGTLMGDGRLSSAGGGVLNTGTVAPGSFGAGTLSLAGSFSQATGGTLAIELTSLGSHDLLAVSGGAVLGGTLALACLEDCSFAVGDSFLVLTSATRGGSFAAVSLSGFATGAFDVVYEATGVRLVVTEAVSAVPEPGSAALWLAGLGAVAWLRRRRAGAGG